MNLPVLIRKYNYPIRFLLSVFLSLILSFCNDLWTLTCIAEECFFYVHVLDISFTCFNIFTNWFIIYLCRSHHAPRDRVTGCGESHRKWGQWLLSPQTLEVLKKVFNTYIMCTGKNVIPMFVIWNEQWGINHREYQYDFLCWYIIQNCFKLWILSLIEMYTLWNISTWKLNP